MVAMRAWIGALSVLAPVSLGERLQEGFATSHGRGGSHLELDEFALESANHTDGIGAAASKAPWAALITKKKTLGSGAFGRADLVELKAPCEGRAVSKQLLDCSARKDWRIEIEAMKSLNHPNIIGYIDSYPHDEEKWCVGALGKQPKALEVLSTGLGVGAVIPPEWSVFGKPPRILMEVAKGGEIKKFMDANRPGWFASRNALSKEKAKKLAERREVKVRMVVMALVDTLKALVYMNEQQWVHRDIKDDNIWETTGDGKCVAEGTCSFVLGDIGLARRMDKTCGTGSNTFACHKTFVFFPRAVTEPQPLQAPEVARDDFWASGSDVFHLGAAFELIYRGWTQNSLNGRSAEKGARVRQMMAERPIYEDVPAKVKAANIATRQLLLDMTEPRISARPPVGEALARAEEIYQELYGREKPARVPDIPACLKECVKCGQDQSCEAHDQGVQCV